MTEYGSSEIAITVVAVAAFAWFIWTRIRKSRNKTRTPGGGGTTPKPPTRHR